VVGRACRCDSNDLKQLLEDTLPPERQAVLIGHLDDCAACQETLERFAADQLWWAELHHLRSRLGAEADLGHDGLPAEEPLSLDFLDPPQEDGQLGRLDSFLVTALLGRGGMGIVLKALDPHLGRPVAIKVLAPCFASSAAARRRFAREARAAAAVVHEHVVPIYSVAAWKGLPYLVMACVAGRSVQERLNAEGPLGVAEVLRIGMQAAAGLAAAHAQGLVHRDIKPANILLEDGVERVLLTDFGLARAADDASLTQSGVIAGTPPYMAPEQALGAAVDHRADLFSLGSTLYAMCAGHPPFRAESAMAVLRRVCEEQPRPIQSLNPDVPAWLEGIISRLHAKDPIARFQSAAEVADLLGRCLAHVQQPEAISLPPEIASQRPNRRHRRWLHRAGFAFFTLVGLAVALSYYWKPPQEHHAEEPIPLANPTVPVPLITPAGDETPLDVQLQVLRQRTAALEAGLRARAIDGSHDPADALLEDLRRRVQALEASVLATSPRK
jgi:serine/threonine-protein kinase